MVDSPNTPDAPQAPQLWIVSPSYHDVESFQLLRQRIIALRQRWSVAYDIHFVLVDDTGGTDHRMSDLAPLDDVMVVELPFNVGHQRAIVFGLRSILDLIDDADLIVTMDADGEDRPEDLPRLLAPLEENPSELGFLSVARRTKRQESIRFRTMYFLFRNLFRILTGTTVRSGNFAAYRGGLAKRILMHPYFDLCYSSTLVSLDVPVTLVPCPRGKRYAGRSRMNLLRLFMHGTRMLMPFTDRIAVRALVAFTTAFALGIVLSVSVVAIRVFSTAAIPGWATATLLGILILSFIALGNFVVLFVVFSHSRGISLSGLEEYVDGGTRSTPASPD